MTTIRREISHWIRIAWRRRVEATLNYDNLTGLSDGDITLTQRVTSKTQEPYIYFRSDGSDEVDATKDDTPRDYDTTIEVVTKVVGNTGGPIQNDEITDEIVKNIRTNPEHFPDLVERFGINVYVVTVEPVSKFKHERGGATYWRSVINITTRASDISGDELVIPPDDFGDIVVNRPITGTSDLPAAPTADGRYDLVRNGDTLSWLVIPNDQGSVVSVTVEDGEATEITIDGTTTALGGGDEVSINSEGTVITINGEDTTLAGTGGGGNVSLTEGRAETFSGSRTTTQTIPTGTFNVSLDFSDAEYADIVANFTDGGGWINFPDSRVAINSIEDTTSNNRIRFNVTLTTAETIPANTAVGVFLYNGTPDFQLLTAWDGELIPSDLTIDDVNGFNSIAFPASSDNDVDATADDRQLRIVAGQGVAVGNSSTDEFNAITISIADDSFKNFDIFSQGSDTRTVRVEAEQAEDTINFRAGTGITITGEEIGVGDNITWNVDIPSENNTLIRTNEDASGLQATQVTESPVGIPREFTSGGNFYVDLDAFVADEKGGAFELTTPEGENTVVAYLGVDGNWIETFTNWDNAFHDDNTLTSLILTNTATNATIEISATNTYDNFLNNGSVSGTDFSRTWLDITCQGSVVTDFIDFANAAGDTDIQIDTTITPSGNTLIAGENLEAVGRLFVGDVEGDDATFHNEIRLLTRGDYIAAGDAQTTDIGVSGRTVSIFEFPDNAGLGTVNVRNQNPALVANNTIQFAGQPGAGTYLVTGVNGDTVSITPNLRETIPFGTTVQLVLGQEFTAVVPQTFLSINQDTLNYTGLNVNVPQITFPDGTTQTSAPTGEGTITRDANEIYTNVIISSSPADLTTETLPTGYDGGNVYTISSGDFAGTYYRIYASDGASEQLRSDTIDGDVIYQKNY